MDTYTHAHTHTHTPCPQDPWGPEGGPVVDPSDVHELGRAGGVKLTHYPPPKPKVKPQGRRQRQLLAQPRQSGAQALLQQGVRHEQQQQQLRQPSLLQRLWSKLTGGSSMKQQQAQYELSDYEDEDWEDEDMEGVDGRRMDRRGRSLTEDEQSRFEIETDAIFHLQVRPCLPCCCGLLLWLWDGAPTLAGDHA